MADASKTDVHVLHIKDRERTWWVLADATNTIRGQTLESKDAVLGRWEKLHGKPPKLVTYREYYSLAEAAATLAEIQG